MAEMAAADLIAVCGEATAVPFIIYRPRDAMLASLSTALPLPPTLPCPVPSYD